MWEEQVVVDSWEAVVSCGRQQLVVGGSSSTSIAQQMTEVIEERIDQVIWTINNRRRSDSNELPSFTTEVDMEANAQAIHKNKVDF